MVHRYAPRNLEGTSGKDVCFIYCNDLDFPIHASSEGRPTCPIPLRYVVGDNNPNSIELTPNIQIGPVEKQRTRIGVRELPSHRS